MRIKNYILPNVGDRIKLIEMVDDPYPIEPDTEGVVDYIDSLNNIHVTWDDGRTLSLVPGVDRYKILTMNESNVKTFEQFIFETGEWPRYATLDYLNENPDEADDDEFLGWIQDMKNNMEQIMSVVNDDVDISIYGIHGFDTYQGPYGVFDINGNKYKIWYAGNPEFYIEDFPYNMMDKDEMPGIKGDVWFLGKAINTAFSVENMLKLNTD